MISHLSMDLRRERKCSLNFGKWNKLRKKTGRKDNDKRVKVN